METIVKLEANDGPLLLAAIFLNQIMLIDRLFKAVLCCCFRVIRGTNSVGVGIIFFGDKSYITSF